MKPRSGEAPVPPGLPHPELVPASQESHLVLVPSASCSMAGNQNSNHIARPSKYPSPAPAWSLSPPPTKPLGLGSGHQPPPYSLLKTILAQNHLLLVLLSARRLDGKGPSAPHMFPVDRGPAALHPQLVHIPPPSVAQSSPTFLGKSTHLLWGCIPWGRGLHSRLIHRHVKAVTGHVLVSGLHPGQGLLATATGATHTRDLGALTGHADFWKGPGHREGLAGLQEDKCLLAPCGHHPQPHLQGHRALTAVGPCFWTMRARLS